jgi:hypothetical protein
MLRTALCGADGGDAGMRLYRRKDNRQGKIPSFAFQRIRDSNVGRLFPHPLKPADSQVAIWRHSFTTSPPDHHQSADRSLTVCTSLTLLH